MGISGKTTVCGIVGDPIEHTLSPTMHNAAFTNLSLDFVYLAFRVAASELKSAMVGMRSLGFRGLNITMPHKSAVVRYLDEVDSTANSVGAVNTILNDAGSLVGFNTDGIGALKALQETGVQPNGKKVLLLGAGGAGKAIAFCVAGEAKELTILNRTTRRATELAKILRHKFGTKVSGNTLSPQLIKKELKNTDILINATSVGMHPGAEKSLVVKSWMRPDLCVMDIVYNPADTKLAKEAKSVGAKVVNGVDMLVYQGAASFEIWTNRIAPINVMKQAVLDRLSYPAGVNY